MKNPVKIGEIQSVPIREVFKHEAHDFTAWLKDNIQLLSQAIDLPLTVDNREMPVGRFFADLVCTDIQGNKVVIENQLEVTDHDHFGKLITYMGNLKANTGIWITPSPRIEHQAAVEHFNSQYHQGLRFFLVKVEAIRIDNSNPAPLFTVVVRPPEQPIPVVETEIDQYVARPEKEFKPEDTVLPPVWCFYPRRDEPTYQLFLKENVVGLGFGDYLGDLREIESTPEAFKALWARHNPLSSPAETRTFYAMFYSLVHRVKVGDLIIYAPTWRERVIYLGRITSDYFYQRHIIPFYAHRRTVEWIEDYPRDTFSPEALKGIAVTLAIFQARNERFLQELSERLSD
jgi:hypothetical protein